MYMVLAIILVQLCEVLLYNTIQSNAHPYTPVNAQSKKY